MPALAPQGASGAGVRQQAAQVAVPHGSTVTITHTAAPGKGGGGGKSPTAGKAAQKVAGAGATKAAAAPAAAFNPLAGYLTTPQLGNLANNITAENLKATLAPLRQQAGQIQNSEGTVANRYAGYNALGDQQLAGLQGDQQASALTADNQTAQMAQATANAIAGVKGTAAAQNGGYVDPAVAAALQNASTYLGTTGAGQATLAGQNGQSGNNLLANIRGTAALQAVEGQGNIASDYAKQLATNRASQNAAVLKAIPTAKDLASTLGQQQFADWATQQGLGIKKGALNVSATKTAEDYAVAQRKNQIAGENAGTQRINAQSEASYRAAEAAIGNRKVGVTQQLGLINAAEKTKGLSVDQQHYLLVYKAALAKIKAAQSEPSSAQTKVTDEIEGQAAYYKTLTGYTNPATGKTVSPAAARVSVIKGLKNDGVAGQAAVELGSTGSITPATAAALRAQGITIPASWLPKALPVKQITAHQGL